MSMTDFLSIISLHTDILALVNRNEIVNGNGKGARGAKKQLPIGISVQFTKVKIRNLTNWSRFSETLS
jgi:hypothetical protein